MFKQTDVTTNKTYQLDFLKIVVLNRSTKGAMGGSVRRVHFSKPFIDIKKVIMISTTQKMKFSCGFGHIC